MSIATKSLDERQMGSSLTLLRGCKTQCRRAHRVMYVACKKIGESDEDRVGVATTKLSSHDNASTLCGDTLQATLNVESIT
ncbi:hypothetical protein MTO96_034046 [Rhipicephalus appendiculatus]